MFLIAQYQKKEGLFNVALVEISGLNFQLIQVVQKTKKIPIKKIASVSKEKNNKKTINVIQNETGPKKKKEKKLNHELVQLCILQNICKKNTV